MHHLSILTMTAMFLIFQENQNEFSRILRQSEGLMFVNMIHTPCAQVIKKILQKN